MRSRVVVLWALAGCAAAQVPRRIERRSIEVVHEVTLTGLPTDSRVTLEGVVLANRVTDTASLVFTYAADEEVDNGVPKRTNRSEVKRIAVQAPGYLPRMIDVAVPGPAVIDAHLDLPPIAATRVSDAARDDVDAGLGSVLAGRCDEANALFDKAKAKATGRHDAARIDALAKQCRANGLLVAPAWSWSPSSADVGTELAASPEAAISALDDAMRDAHDEVGRQGLKKLVDAATLGRLDEAGRLAALVAAPMTAPRAALVLQLPVAQIAAQTYLLARTALKLGDTQQALELAIEARHAAPWVSPAAFETIRTARAKALETEGARLEHANNALLARAYYLGAAAAGADQTDALTRTRDEARSAARLELAMVSADGTHDSTVESALAEALPPYVNVTADLAHADAVLSYAVDSPKRTHRARTIDRTRSITVGQVSKPNPDYTNAQYEVRNAEHGLERARETYDELHQKALEAADQAKSMSGAYAIAMATTAASSEAAGRKILSDAESDLDSARNTLARTPRTLRETLTAEARYPVVVLESEVSIAVRARIDGYTTPIEDSFTATAALTSEQVQEDSALGVSGQSIDAAAHAGLTPPVGAQLSEMGKRLAHQLHTAEADSTWGMLADLRARGDLEAAAILGVAYLMIEDDEARRDDFVEYLARRLP